MTFSTISQLDIGNVPTVWYFFFFILLVLRVFQMKGNMGYSDLDCMVDLHLFIQQCPIKVTIMILVNVVENVVKLTYSQSESSFSID